MDEHTKTASGTQPDAVPNNNSRNDYSPHDAPITVAFTRFESAKPLSKTFALVDRSIVKTSAAQMTGGVAHRIECGFADFGKVLDRMTAQQATGYGLHDTAQYKNPAGIVVNNNADPPQTIARTKAYFNYRNETGVLMLDHDWSKFGPSVPAKDLQAILAGISPAFNNAACWFRGSVSSGVCLAGQAPKESANFHLYYAVPDASDIPRFGAVLYRHLWLAGHGYIALAKDGSLLERTLIDGAVFSGERLDFTGRPAIKSDGLEYTPPKSEYRAGGFLDTKALLDLSPVEEAEYQRLVDLAKAAIKPEADKARSVWIDEKVLELEAKGTLEPEARKHLERLAKGQTRDLPSSFLLHFANLGTVTVAEVLANLKKYDGQALADPIEGPEYGQTTAKFYANAGKGAGKPCINSFAHGAGTVYFLNASPVDDPSQDEEDAFMASSESGEYEPPPLDSYSDRALPQAEVIKKSQSTILIELSEKWQYFYAADTNRTVYARIPNGNHRENHPIRSIMFKEILAGEFYKLEKKGCNQNAISDALNTISARAKHNTLPEDVFLRVARAEQKIYIDLADADWRVIEVTKTGWEMLDESPVNFIRKNGMTSLPVPVQGGSLNHLRPFVNTGEQGFKLVVGWIIGAFHGKAPYPILILQGEQGSGKSVLAKVLRLLVDPSTTPLRSPPRELRDLLVSAINTHVCCLDNLSGINPEISDALCRLSTGGGLDARRLYTDYEQVLIDIEKPVICNGIDTIAARPDLAERSIILNLPSIDPGARRDEKTFWREFETARPSILGGILMALSCALRNEDSVHIAHKPRMADFATWIEAASPALGWKEGEFLSAYTGMQDGAVLDGIEASPIGSAIMTLMDDDGGYEGRSTDLLNKLTEISGSQAKSPFFPKTEKALWNAMNRLKPSFRRLGIEIEKTRKNDGRHYKITKGAIKASQASQASLTQQRRGFQRDAYPSRVTLSNQKVTLSNQRDAYRNAKSGDAYPSRVTLSNQKVMHGKSYPSHVEPNNDAGSSGFGDACDACDALKPTLGKLSDDDSDFVEITI